VVVWECADVASRSGPEQQAAEKPRQPLGCEHVARRFVPTYDGAVSIIVPVRRPPNSDARRRLARLFTSRRLVS
jgi:hypothetical protein